MKKFIKKLIIFLLIMVICSGGIVAFHRFVVGGQYEYSYMASAVDKLDRLKSINEPKIVLVGHSNLAFGINSQKIEEAMGMQVVNLGIHGGLGNAFYERLAKENINEGDIIVICHSTFSDTGEIPDPSLAWLAYDYNSEIWPLITDNNLKNILLAYPKYVKSSLFLWASGRGNVDGGGSYSRSAFNEYGDIVYKPESGQMDVELYFSTFPNPLPEINDICTDRLNQLNQYITERGATMVVAGYPIAYGKYADFTQDDFKEFKKQLEDALDCEVISDYTDYFYPYDYFYDTELHLTEEGADIRTQQLITDLKKWQN